MLERRQHQDADPGAEIAAVDADRELEENRPHEPFGGFVRFRIAGLEHALHRFLRHEEQGREENEERHQPVEERRASSSEAGALR